MTATTLSLRAPSDVLAAVPYLFGFHPADSVVVLGLRGRRLVFQVRADLTGAPTALAGYFTDLLTAQRLDTGIVVGYGSPEQVGPVVTEVRDRFLAAGISTPEVLRASGGRYWSYSREQSCCPPEGTPYDGMSSVIAAEATVAGMVALPSRDELRRRLAPVTGLARVAMTQATDRADERARYLVVAALDCAADGAEELAGERAVRAARATFDREGRQAVDSAVRHTRAGGVLDDDEAAWISVLLLHLPVRDHAWAGIESGDLRHQIELWTDLTRRAEPELRVAPATLLAFACWLAGEGALSSIGLQTALETDPDYRLAQLLYEAINGGLNPNEWCAGPGRRLRRRHRRRSI